jgi:hypothetical protein
MRSMAEISTMPEGISDASLRSDLGRTHGRLDDRICRFAVRIPGLSLDEIAVVLEESDPIADVLAEIADVVGGAIEALESKPDALEKALRRRHAS